MIHYLKVHCFACWEWTDIKANGHGDSKPDEDGEQAYEDVEDISPLRALVEALNPINLEEWPEMRWWARIYEVFKVRHWLTTGLFPSLRFHDMAILRSLHFQFRNSTVDQCLVHLLSQSLLKTFLVFSFQCPIVFVINISCPVVNYEVEETWNWNKYLFVLQSFVAPTMFVLCLQCKCSNPRWNECLSALSSQ